MSKIVTYGVWTGSSLQLMFQCKCQTSAPPVQLVMEEKISFKWNDFEANIMSSFGELRDEKDFTNVTLACEDREFEAHQWILRSCSPFFRSLLKKVKNHQHPLIYMRGVTGSNLEAMVDFVYRGEADIFQENLDSFLVLAEELQLRGLAGNDETDDRSQKQTNSNIKQERSPPFNIKVEEEKKVLESKGSNQTSYGTHGGVVSMGQRTKETVQVQVSAETARKVEAMLTQVQVSEETARKVEAMIKKQDGLWTCLVCNLRSSKNCHLKEHVETHIEGLQYPCNNCGKVLSTRKARRRHMCN